MAKATTFNKDSPQKPYSKRIVSHLRTPDGKVVNKAAGDNDVGTIIKSQFNPDLRPKTSTFEEQHAREDKQGKRIISHNHSFVL